jgi:predicted dehydrogenase
MTGEAKRCVRWGILSTANIATKLARAINLADGAELTAVASRTEERAKRWASEHGVKTAYGNYASLLEDPEIDAVYNPLPPSMHAEWTIKAAAQGKHVLCEKPLEANAEKAIAMADACRQHNVQLMDGVMWVHHERTTRMKQVIDDGILGRLRRVTAAFTTSWDKIPEDNIRAKKELAGGCLGDLGYYCVRCILWAFGDLPTQVFATARYYRGVELNLSGTLWFENERIAAFDCGYDTASRRWFEVAGTQASIVCDDFVIPRTEDSTRFWIHGAQGRNEEHKGGGCIQEVRMIEQFSNIVRTGQLEPRWQAEAINTMRVCDALSESARLAQVVQIG